MRGKWWVLSGSAVVLESKTMLWLRLGQPHCNQPLNSELFYLLFKHQTAFRNPIVCLTSAVLIHANVVAASG